MRAMPKLEPTIKPSRAQSTSETSDPPRQAVPRPSDSGLPPRVQDWTRATDSSQWEQAGGFGAPGIPRLLQQAPGPAAAGIRP